MNVLRQQQLPPLLTLTQMRVPMHRFAMTRGPQPLRERQIP